MNSSTYRFALDMHSAQSQISVPVLLGDTGRTFRIILSDGGNSYIIKDGCLAKLTIKRPTGTHIEEFCTIEDNTTIVYPFSQNENTAAVEGIHECDITLYDLDGEKITGPRFTMVVSERAINSDDIVITDEDFTAVDAMLVAEANRQVAEQERIIAESARNDAEKLRKSTEEEIKRAEKLRSQSEIKRNEDESKRISNESNRISNEDKRISNEEERASNEGVRVEKDAKRDASIQNALDASSRAEANAETALEKANIATEDVADFREEIGSEALIMADKTVKGSVNHAVTTAHAAKKQSDATHTSLINISAQVHGISRTYVVPDFLSFISFLNERSGIELKEDRNGDGVDETYNIYISDLKSGDNIIIVEEAVPDFWFEKNSSLTSFDTYTYNGTKYILSAASGGATIGGVHILAADYLVVEDYAISASASAQDAKESEIAAATSEAEAKEAAASASNSTEEAKKSEIKAKEYANEAKMTVFGMRVEGKTLYLTNTSVSGKKLIL